VSSHSSIPAFYFGPNLLAHHTYGMAGEVPRDPREQPVLVRHDPEPYRVTPEAVERAKLEAAKERAKLEAAKEREEAEAAQRGFHVRKETALNTLTGLVNEFGLPLVQSWLNYVARAERP
jgi:hypothetical protein